MSLSDYARVTLYKDKNYGSTSVTLAPGRYANIATATGMPRNDVSSIKVTPYTTVTLCSKTDYGGNCIKIVGPIEIPDLSRYGSGFNNATESVIVDVIQPSSADILSCCKGEKSVCGPYTPGTPVCDRAIAGYCKKNMGTPYCQSWCRTHPELCDAQVIAYCKANPGDPYCACVLSKATGVANPKCVDDKCVRFGYLTTNMRDTPCPSIVDCSIRAKLVNNGVTLANVVPIEQNCGNSPSGTGTKSSSGSTSGTTTKKSSKVTTVGNPTADTIAAAVGINWTLVLFVVLAIVLAIVGIMWWTSDPEPAAV